MFPFATSCIKVVLGNVVDVHMFNTSLYILDNLLSCFYILHKKASLSYCKWESLYSKSLLYLVNEFRSGFRP